jgi:hypothetical protein
MVSTYFNIAQVEKNVYAIETDAESNADDEMQRSSTADMRLFRNIHIPKRNPH